MRGHVERGPRRTLGAVTAGEREACDEGEAADPERAGIVPAAGHVAEVHLAAAAGDSVGDARDRFEDSVLHGISSTSNANDASTFVPGLPGVLTITTTVVSSE